MFDYNFYKFIHIVALVVFCGYIFYAFIAPAEMRKRVLILIGIAALLMLISGAALVAKAGHSWDEKWIWVKIACWLGIAAMPGLAFRRRAQASKFQIITLVLFAVAILMAIYKFMIF